MSKHLSPVGHSRNRLLIFVTVSATYFALIALNVVVTPCKVTEIGTCGKGQSPMPTRWPRIAFLGDSLTRGDGSHESGSHHHGPSKRTIAGRGNYPLAIKALKSNLTVANFGHDGTTVSPRNICSKTAGPYAGTDVYTEAIQWNADIYVVMLGTNDMLFCWNSTTFEYQLERLIQSLLKLSRKTRVALIIPPPLTGHFSKYDPLLQSELEPLILSLVERLEKVSATPNSRVMSIDLRSAFESQCSGGHFVDSANCIAEGRATKISRYNDCFCSADDAMFHADGLHPSKRGSIVIARTVILALQVHQWVPLQHKQTVNERLFMKGPVHVHDTGAELRVENLLVHVNPDDGHKRPYVPDDMRLLVTFQGLLGHQ